MKTFICKSHASDRTDRIKGMKPEKVVDILEKKLGKKVKSFQVLGQYIWYNLREKS